jgi:hypothetical protein
VLDSVFAAEPYRWTPPPAVLRLLSEWWRGLVAWLEGLRTDNPLVFRALFVVILLLWLGIFAHAGWLVWHTIRGASRSEGDPAPPPVGEPHDADWHLRAADRAAEEGRFTEAVQLAFVAVALTLERAGLLRYHPSKTPAECAREARLMAADRERLVGLVRILYASAFGGRVFGLEDYRRWRELGTGPWHAATR